MLRLVKKLQAIENWQESVRAEKAVRAVSMKETRAAYFEERAGRMDPPMEPEAVRLCESYIQAVAIHREPTNRSWTILRSKLDREREEAETALYSARLVIQEEAMVARRISDSSPEQQYVLSLADAVITQSIESDLSSIALADFVPIVLQRFYEAYQKREDKPIGLIGEHRLIIDDALLIYETMMIPRLRNSGHRPEIFEKMISLRCAICQSTESYHFPSLMDHVYKVHYHNELFSSIGVKRREYGSPPWFCLLWPRSLPIHKAS